MPFRTGVIQALSAVLRARRGRCRLPYLHSRSARGNVVIKLGKKNKLQVVKPAPHGVFLDAGADGELFLSEADLGKALSVG